jgi:hypothetical protein
MLNPILVSLAVAGFILWIVAIFVKRRGRPRAAVGMFFVGILMMLPAIGQDIGQRRSAPPAEVPEPAVHEPTLGIAASDLVGRFNAVAEEHGLETRLTQVEEKVGEEAVTFTATISPNVGMLGTVDKESREVAGVMLVFSGGGTEKAMDNFLCLMESATVLINLCTPGLTPDERGLILKECGFLDADKDEGETIRGSVKYSNMRSSSAGWWFSVSPI